MKKHFSLPIILSLLGIFVLLCSGLTYFTNFSQQDDTENFQKKLRSLEDSTDQTLEQLKNSKTLSNIKNTADIGYFIYEDKELIYWSSNLISLPEIYEQTLFSKKLLKLNNGYYALRHLKYQNRIFIGLIPIYYNYPVTNEFLKNGFNKALPTLYQTTISFDVKQGHPIYNKEGNFLFSIKKSATFRASHPLLSLLSILLFVGFFLFANAFIILLQKKRYKNNFIIGIGGILAIIALRGIMLGFRIPNFLYSLPLFHSDLHASSKLFPSLGDYFLNAFTLFICVYILSLLNFRKQLLGFSKKQFIGLLVLTTTLITLSHLAIISQIESLVLNSSFSLQLHIGSNIEKYVIWGYAGASFFLISTILLTRILVKTFRKSIPLSLFYKITLTILLLILCIDFKTIYHIGFFATLLGFQGLIHYRKKNKPKYALQLIILSITALYLTRTISFYAEQKEHQVRLAKAKSIEQDNNPEIKAILETISIDWNKDDALLSLYQNPIANENKIKNHLRKHYFNHKWFNHNIQFFICASADKISAEDKENCMSHFRHLIKNGTRIGGSPFYEIIMEKGFSSYIGELSFVTKEYGKVKLFIQIEAKTYQNKEQAFPLLLNSNISQKNTSKNYCFAKYYSNKLRYSSGDFSYYKDFNSFYEKSPQNSEELFIKLDGYTHYIYNASKNYKIVISDKTLSFYNKYTAFPYIFLFLFTILIFLWLIEISNWNNLLLPSFRLQIQLALLLTIKGIFVIVGGLSLYYHITQNEALYKKQYEQKSQMLSRELFSNIEKAKELDVHFSLELKEKLNKYADIIGADINIYDAYGVLVSSSEPEIFEKGLLSTLMNFDVLKKLKRQKISKVLTQNKIGELEYTSVYITIWNTKNEQIGYLNIPFFKNYTAFKSEIQDIVFTVLNIYLLLIILTFIVAFFISRQIARPLMILQRKFTEIKFGKENKKITYRHNDEVKSLIDSYNKMVDELTESHKRLSKSERENAWREMAKQVAHEIKNPLTPMKLNLQFLQHKFKQNPENWQEIFKESSAMLLSQIDELANIATAFSNFAQMPKIHNEQFDIIALLKDITLLYSKGEVKVQFSCKLKSATVFADKNRIRGSLINLIRNGIQAISNHHQGEIKIAAFLKKNNTIAIEISDNGKGIPLELREKIFSPRFTTKNSGMGLGLALTKDCILQSKGSIDFETEENKGTTFFISLPILDFS